MSTEENTENILGRLQKQRSNKLKFLIIIFSVIGIIILLALLISAYFYFKSPEKTLGIGANIESALLSADGKISYLKLTGGSLDKNITKIKFIFSDENGNEYNYETSEGAKEIEVPFKRSFLDWLFGKPAFSGKYDYQINSNEIGLENFENVNEVSVVFEYKTETGDVIETPVLDTEKPLPPQNKTTSGGGNGGGNGGTTTCTPTKTCLDYLGQCGSALSDGCDNILNCSNNCENGFYCYTGEGIKDICINNSITCLDSDNKNYYVKGNVTTTLFKEDSCLGNNVTEFYCYYNGSEFEIRNDTFTCSNGCSNGACSLPQCTHNNNCTFLNNICSYGVCNASNKCQQLFNSSSTICRASQGICDITERCTGTTASCPANNFNSSTTICRASVGECDLAEYCNGTSSSCSANVFKLYGTSCSLGFCDGIENCIPNFCLGITECVDYTDSVNCTNDLCRVGNCRWNSTSGGCYNYGGNVYYVDIDGVGEDGILGTTDDVISNDTNPGTSSAPWKTLTKAQATLVHGDTVLVRNGNYGSLSFTSAVDSNNWTEKITYKAAPGHTPVLTGLSSSYWWKVVHRYLEFDGFTINVPDDGVRRAGIYFKNADYLRFLNCTINGVWKDPGSGGLSYYGIQVGEENVITDMNDILIENCYVRDVHNGIVMYGSLKDNIIVRNNTVYHTSGSSILIDSSTNNILLIEGNHLSWQEPVDGAHGSCIEIRARNLTVRNNIIHNCGNTGGITTYSTTFDGQGGRPSSGFTNMLFENNLVYDTLNINPTRLGGIGQNFVFRNNTIIGMHWAGQNYALWYGGASSFSPWDSNFDGSGLIIANNVLVGILGLDKLLFSKAIITGNVIYSFGGFATGWYNSTEFPGNIIVKTNNSSPNPTYFEGSGTFFEGGELFDQYSYTRLNDSRPHGVNLDDTYYPVMTSDACNGSINPIGVAVGALPCVCTNDTQCEQVFGSNYICENEKCVEKIGGTSASLSPFTKLLNFLKGLLTKETGNAILTGKTITGNAVSNANIENLEKSESFFEKIISWLKNFFI